VRNKITAVIAKGSSANSLGIFMGSVRPGAIIRMVAGIEYVTYLNTGFSPEYAITSYY
jgi:hypothetical protein